MKIDMCKALEEWKEELLESGMEAGIEVGMNAGLQKGKLYMLTELVREGILTVEIAAEKAEMTVDEFNKMLFE